MDAGASAGRSARHGRNRLVRRAIPSRYADTARKRQLVARLKTPSQVQTYLNRLPYNYERWRDAAHLPVAWSVTVRRHCLEAALFAATVLDLNGYAPRVISFESVDKT